MIKSSFPFSFEICLNIRMSATVARRNRLVNFLHPVFENLAANGLIGSYMSAK